MRGASVVKNDESIMDSSGMDSVAINAIRLKYDNKRLNLYRSKEVTC
jgi:hypothetical protein